MASGQTEHYGLNQWESNDQVLREEFNQDNTKIDMALRQKFGLDLPSLVTGTYVGTYSGSDTPTAATVDLGFRPAFVIIFNLGESSDRYDDMAMLGNPDAQVILTFGASQVVGTSYLTFSDTGFTVDRIVNYTSGFNHSGVTYLYFAFR